MSAAQRLAAIDELPARDLIAFTEGTLRALVDVMNNETTLLRTGHFRAATELTAEKTRLAQDYVVYSRAVQRQIERLKREAPDDIGLLKLGHDRLATQMAENLKVIATAKAVTDAVVLVVPVEQTEHWMREYRTWYHFVVGTYRRRYEELLETIDHIAFQNMDERLEFYLRRHRQALHTNVLELTNTQIAQELNSSREVISRLMKKLAEAGKVRLLKNGVELLKI